MSASILAFIGPKAHENDLRVRMAGSEGVDSVLQVRFFMFVLPWEDRATAKSVNTKRVVQGCG
jgi:hypothetical protein